MNNIDSQKIRQRSRLSFFAFFTFVCALILISVVVGLLLGSASLSPSTIWSILKMKLFGIADEDIPKTTISIIWGLRFPRILLAIVAGGGLAVAGASMQAVTQNVLAEPYILGVSSGASAMVALAYFLGGNIVYNTSYGVSLFAFVGAIGSLALVYIIGLGGSAGSSTRLVLAGVTVSVILQAFCYLFMSISPNPDVSKNIMAWIMGSLAGARWNNLLLPTVSSVVGLIFLMLSARAYNLISLGDETAISLGVNVVLIKRITIALVSLVTGFIVAAGGIIGFVGFVVPHIVRMLIGSDHRRLFPTSYLVGSLFLLWMDILARTIVAPKELPIGIFTALFGGPFFIMLIYRKNKTGRI